MKTVLTLPRKKYDPVLATILREAWFRGLLKWTEEGAPAFEYPDLRSEPGKPRRILPISNEH